MPPPPYSPKPGARAPSQARRLFAESPESWGAERFLEDVFLLRVSDCVMYRSSRDILLGLLSVAWLLVPVVVVLAARIPVG